MRGACLLRRGTLLAGMLAFLEGAALADTVDPALCQALVKHVPSSDVAYQPGVDTQGKPVAPADLPGGSSFPLPETIRIPLTVNMAKAMKVDTASYPYSLLGQGTEASLGLIEVSGDHVSLNGQPLTDAQQDNLAVLCLRPQ